MKKLLMLCLLSITACTTESGPATADTDDTVSSATSEISVSPTEAKPADVTCFALWRCRTCGGNREQNYLQDKCSDGTTTIEMVGPCGEPCF